MKMTKQVIIDQDIGFFRGFFDEKLCKDIIAFYEENKKTQLTKLRDYQTHGVVDGAISVVEVKNAKVIDDTLKVHGFDTFTNQFLTIFWNEVYTKYVERYIGLGGMAKHTIYDIKIQKTLPEGGFHRWHMEKSGKEYRDRIMAFMLYLNTIESGGETEFLHQRLKFKPNQGDFLLWPVSYTHTHRGDPPFSGDKYILTGWVEFE